MTKYEQEVVINLNAENDMAAVYSANPEWIRKMDGLCEEFPNVFRIKRWTLISKTYEVPKEYIRIGKPGDYPLHKGQNWRRCGMLPKLEW